MCRYNPLLSPFVHNHSLRGPRTCQRPEMGQSESVPGSPLDCLLKNFSDFQRWARGYGGPPPDLEFLRTLSQLEWPTFNVGWPMEGSFDLPTLFAVRATVYQVPHPDRYVYIDVWVDIATGHPSYISKCTQANGRSRRAVCVASRPGTGREKEGKQETWAPYELLFGQPIPLVPRLTREEREATNHNFLKPLHRPCRKSGVKYGLFGKSPHRRQIRYPISQSLDSGCGFSTIAEETWNPGGLAPTRYC